MATLYPIAGAETPLDVYSARDLGAHHGTVRKKRKREERERDSIDEFFFLLLSTSTSTSFLSTSSSSLFKPKKQATSVAWSCSAHRLASGGVDGCVKIWAPERTRPGAGAFQNLASQNQNQNQTQERPVAEIRLPSSSASKASTAATAPAAAPPPTRARPPRVNRLAWHPSLPEILAVASDDGASVRLFDARTGGEASSKSCSNSNASSSSSSSSSSFVALLTPPSPAPRCAAISLAWCPGKGKRENLIAVGSDADFVSFFDASSGKLLALLPPPSPGVEVNEAVFSSDGTVFARAVGTHGAVELFSVEELLEKGGGGSGGSSSDKGAPPSSASDWKGFRCPVKPFATLHGHTSTVFALSTVAAGNMGEGGNAMGPSSFLLASGGADGACVVWDLRYGSPLATCGAFDHQVKSVSLGGGWSCSSNSSSSPSKSKTTCGNLIAFSGESDTIVVDDWTLSPATGDFLPARSPTTPLVRAAASPRPYPFRVFVPRVESVAWAPAVVVSGSESSAAPPTSAAAAGSSENENPSSSLLPSSKRSQQSNVGALAFVRCIPAGGAQQQQGGGGGRVAGGEVVGAVGLFAPPPSSSSSSSSR